MNASCSLGRHEIDALVGEMHRVALLVEHEEQVVLHVAVRLLGGGQPPVGDVLELHLLHELLVARLLQHLHQAPALRTAELRLVQLAAPRLCVSPRLEVALGLADERVDELRLPAHDARDGGVVLEVHRVVLVADRTRDDERRPRLVDEHGVHFVDDRVDVGALHALVERHDHVVAQVVEAELVVRAVGDVGEVRRAALGRAGLGVVETPDGEAEVVVEVPHPLRVAAGEVRVDRHEVRALSGQRVQVQRQRRDERLAFAGRHFGDLAEVQLDAAHELDVVGHHVPRQLAAGDHDRRSAQPAGGFAHGGERLGQDLVEHLGDLVAQAPSRRRRDRRRRSARRRCDRARPGRWPIASPPCSVGDARLELARSLGE